jgi:parallel beta-helix repeat protein
MGRLVASVVITMLLAGTLMLAVNMRFAYAQTGVTVYINSDGSVTPSSAPVSSIDNVTYTLTGNVSSPAYDGIAVERNNTVIDGNGYTVQGCSDEYGGDLTLTGISNVTVENMDVPGFLVGIFIQNAANITVENDTTSGSFAGIDVESSLFVSIINNNVTGLYDPGSSAIYVDQSSGTIVTDNNATGAGYAIMILDSFKNSIISNTAAGVATPWGVGIELESSSDNNVSSNVTPNCCYAICLSDGANNTVADNNITDNSYTQFVINESVVATKTDIINYYGFTLRNCTYGNFTGNNVSGTIRAIDLGSSSHNSFYDNYLINNTIQVYCEDDVSTNAWDDGNRGNLWSDYLIRYPNAKEVDDSGVGNTPYIIDANNTDHHPLTNWTLITKPPAQKLNNPLTNPYLLGLFIGIFAAAIFTALSMSNYVRMDNKIRTRVRKITTYLAGYSFFIAALLLLLIGNGRGGAAIGYFYGVVFFIIASLLLCDSIVLHFIIPNKKKEIENP